MELSSASKAMERSSLWAKLKYQPKCRAILKLSWKEQIESKCLTKTAKINLLNNFPPQGTSKVSTWWETNCCTGPAKRFKSWKSTKPTTSPSPSSRASNRKHYDVSSSTKTPSSSPPTLGSTCSVSTVRWNKRWYSLRVKAKWADYRF